MRLVALCFLAALIAAARAACPTSTGNTLWSQVYGSVAAGADVSINGDVWLDVSPPALGVVTIPAGSGLYFSYRATTPLVLNATNILVYGQLCVGSATARFPGDATIVLSGDPAPGNTGTGGFGTKVIGVAAGATLGLYGQVKTPWTRLSVSALRDFYTNQGPTQINVVDTVNWKATDTILVASTDMPNRVQSERMTISSISGKTITFDSFLKYSHYGEIFTAGGGGDDFVDMRGEVGALNRNVRIVGHSNSDADTWGGHVHIIGTAFVQIDNVEFENTGQTSTNVAETYRYSVFFDNCGDMSGSYVQGSSFHDTMRGAVGLGKTSYLTIKDNVAFNCSGSIFTVAALGVAEGNTIVHNLASTARTNDNYGNTAAAFACGYANNTWTDNSAVEASIGYWFFVPGNNLNAAVAYGSDFWPRYVQLGIFKNNYAHGMVRDGINLASYSPRFWTMANVRGLNATRTPSQIESVVSNRPYSSAIFSDSHFYKCTGAGIASDAQKVQFQRMHLSDNRFGIAWTGIGLLFENTVIIGDSPNVGTPLVPDYEQGRSRPNPYSPDDPIYGVLLLDCCEPAFSSKLRFYLYNDFPFKFVNNVRLAGAIGPQNGRGVGSTDSRFYEAGFSSVQRRILIHPSLAGDWISSFALTDIDGSLTEGVTGGGCGARIVASSPTMYGSSCSFQAPWNAYLCPANDGYPYYRKLNFDDTNNDVYNITRTQAQGILTRLDTGLSTSMLAATPTGGYTLDYETNVAMNAEYMVEFGTVGETPDTLRISISDYMAGNFYTGGMGEWLRIAIPYPSNANFSVAYGSRQLSPGASRTSVNSNTYFWDPLNKLLWVSISADRDNFAYYNKIPFPETGRTLTITADCPTGCTTPSPARPASTATPGAPAFARCLANSDGYLGWANGIPSVTPNGGGNDIFTDALAVGWSSNDNTYLLTNALPFAPAFAIPGVAIWFNWTNFQSTGFYSNNGPVIGSNTHMAFRIRSDLANGLDGALEVDPFICIYNENNAQGCVDVNNPWYSPSGAVNSDAWYSIYVPVQDFGTAFGATNKINQVRFGHNQARTVNVYVDDVRLGTYSVDFVKSAVPVTNSAAATTSSTSGNSSKKKAPVGAIVGGVIGGIIVLALIVAVVALCIMKGGFSGVKEFAARTSRSQPRWAA